MKFNYQVKNPQGQSLMGVLEATSKESALEFLQSKGYFVVLLEKLDDSWFGKKINLSTTGFGDILNFTTQLSILFKASVPLTESLRTIAKMSSKEDLREKIMFMAEKVEGGVPLSQALAEYPKVFSVFYINMVKAGEASGRLSENLDALSEHLKHEKELKDKVVSALIYPAFVLFVLLVVGVAMVEFIIPQFKTVLEGFDKPIPMLSMVIFGVSDYMQKNGAIIGLVLAAAIGFLVWYLNTKEGKDVFDNFMLKVPVIGEVAKKIHVVTFAEALSTLIKAGLPISQAMEITSDILENSTYKAIMQDVRAKVLKGTPMSYVFNQHPDVIPPLLTQMVMVGERTGSLDMTLQKVVEFYRRDVYKATEDAVSLIQPILLVVLGGIVAVMVIGLYYPLITMMGGL